MKFRRSSKATLTCNTRLLFSFVLSFRVTDICKLIIEQLVIVTYDLTCDSTRAQYPRDLRSKLFHLHDDLIFEFILSRFLFPLLSLSLSLCRCLCLSSLLERKRRNGCFDTCFSPKISARVFEWSWETKVRSMPLKLEPISRTKRSAIIYYLIYLLIKKALK